MCFLTAACTHTVSPGPESAAVILEPEGLVLALEWKAAGRVASVLAV